MYMYLRLHPPLESRLFSSFLSPQPLSTATGEDSKRERGPTVRLHFLLGFLHVSHFFSCEVIGWADL
jgi:hypothetical protein